MNDSVQSVVQNPRCPMIYNPRCGNRSSRSLRKNPICETSTLYILAFRHFLHGELLFKQRFLIFFKDRTSEKYDRRSLSRRKETERQKTALNYSKSLETLLRLFRNIRENLIFHNFLEKKRKLNKDR